MVSTAQKLSRDALLAELMARASEPGSRLLQFRSRPGAHQYLRLYELFERYVPAGGSVLDWGAGNGHFSTFLVRRGYRATGYSFEPFDFLEGLRDPAYRAVFADGREPVALPFESGAFDAVSSVGVLEHVRETGGNEGASLREICRVLAPGGHFICYHFPNRWSAIDLVARLIPGKHHHRFRYTERDIERLVIDSGLEFVSRGRYGILPRNGTVHLPVSLRRAAWFARLWDAFDAALGALLAPIVQNWWFVARKPL